MSNNTEGQNFVKCIKDTEGWWTEGESYPASNSAGGFIRIGDDDDPQDQVWSASPIEYREDGTIIYQLGGIEGEVFFEGRQ